MTETRAAKHDLRHHLRVLRGYAEKNDSAQIIDYIDRCFDGLSPWRLNQSVTIMSSIRFSATISALQENAAYA